MITTLEIIMAGTGTLAIIAGTIILIHAMWPRKQKTIVLPDPFLCKIRGRTILVKDVETFDGPTLSDLYDGDARPNYRRTSKRVYPVSKIQMLYNGEITTPEQWLAQYQNTPKSEPASPTTPKKEG